ncbi:MAG: archaemetzincin family Zn-dependent metalloprotease [Bacteroidota bacterium]
MSPLLILPMGHVEEEVLSTAEVCLWETFGFDVQRLSGQPRPDFAFDALRGQFNSELILRWLAEHSPAHTFRLMAVTEVDLFIPMLSFVYGQAQLRGTFAVVSVARMRQEFYGLPPNGDLMLQRLAKEAVHEVGHTFGLTHCLSKGCPMSLATGAAQLDSKGDELCRNCLAVLRDHVKALV